MIQIWSNITYWYCNLVVLNSIFLYGDFKTHWKMDMKNKTKEYYLSRSPPGISYNIKFTIWKHEDQFQHLPPDETSVCYLPFLYQHPTFLTLVRLTWGRTNTRNHQSNAHSVYPAQTDKGLTIKTVNRKGFPVNLLVAEWAIKCTHWGFQEGTSKKKKKGENCQFKVR